MRPRALTVAGAAEALAISSGAAPLSRFTPALENRRDTSNERVDCTTQVFEIRPVTRLESTLRTMSYTLTYQNFPNYSVPMDAELATLEEKIRQAARLCQRLRDENRGLRQQLAALQGDKRQLSEKIDGARNKLETLLKQIPE
jgi:cell division protein ZapB